MEIDIGQLEFISRTQRDLLMWAETKTGYKFTITSLYRIDDKGIHGTLPLRATDLRMRSKEVGQAIEKMINDSWTYDQSRPELKCALLHGSGTNLHLHIQTHQNTVKR